MKTQSRTKDVITDGPGAILNKKILKLKPKDAVCITTIYEKISARYLVIHISKPKQYLDVLPLERFFHSDSSIEVPVMSIPFYMVEDIYKIDKSNLLFLADHHNPHIIKTLEGL